LNCFKREIKSSVDFNIQESEMCGFIKLSRNLARLYSVVPIIDTTGLNGMLSLCTLASPYSFTLASLKCSTLAS